MGFSKLLTTQKHVRRLLNNLRIHGLILYNYLLQCFHVSLSWYMSCVSQTPLSENTVLFPWDIVSTGLSRRLLTSCLKIEEICILSGHFQPRGLVDAPTREIVDLTFLRHFAIIPRTSFSLDKATTYSPTSSSLPQSTFALSSWISSLVLTSFSHLRRFLRSPTLAAEAFTVHNLLGFVILIILKVEVSGSSFTLSGVAKIRPSAEANSLLCWFGGFSLSIVLEELAAWLASTAVFRGRPGLLLGSG